MCRLCIHAVYLSFFYTSLSPLPCSKHYFNVYCIIV
nr:MAG TPA: hypothetical protein [Caudoviricetes sp.]